jgi:hypothetical protein
MAKTKSTKGRKKSGGFMLHRRGTCEEIPRHRRQIMAMAPLLPADLPSYATGRCY